MNSVVETLYLRRPKIEYVSPPVCDFLFSSSGGPVIVLNDISKRRGPSGLILSGEGNFRLSWNTYPGALCYNIYRLEDGEYVIFAECQEATFIDLPPGTYIVTAITKDGETDPSDPIVVSGTPPPIEPTIEEVGMNPINMLAEDGTIVGVIPVGFGRPGIHAGGVTGDLRTETESDPIQASQLATTVTASDTIFQASDVGKVIVFSTSEQAQITAFVSQLQVTVTPSQTVASTVFTIRGETLGGSFGNAHLCNSNGIVAGVESIFGDSQSDYFWLNRATGEIRDLFVFTDVAGFVYSINENGFLLLAHNSGPHISSKLYDPVSQTVTDLGSIDGNLGQTSPKGLNDALQCAVTAQTINNVPFPHTQNKAAIWQSGIMTDLHPAAAGNENSQAVGINAIGHVFGTFFDSVTFNTRSFLNQGGASFDIGGIGDTEVDAIAINDSDTIVGTCDNGSGDFVPFVYSPSGGFQLIPLLPGTTSGQANDVNNGGEVVGNMDGIGFHYKDGVTTPLTDFLPDNPDGWTTLSPLFINNARQVTGYGLHNAALVGFLLQMA